jgi:hypothetical protein
MAAVEYQDCQIDDESKQILVEAAEEPKTYAELQEATGLEEWAQINYRVENKLSPPNLVLKNQDKTPTTVRATK